MNCDLYDGRIVLSEAGRTVELSLSLEWESGGTVSEWRPLEVGRVDGSPGGPCWSVRGAAFALNLETAFEGGFVVLRGRLIGKGDVGVRFRSLRWRFALVKGFAPVEGLFRKCLPYDVWGASRVVEFHAEGRSDFAEYWRSAVFASGQENKALIVAVKLPAAWLHRFEFRPQMVLESRADILLQAGEVLELDPLSVKLCGDSAVELGGPASFTVTRQTCAAAACQTAWNSWDHYRLAVTQDHILENLEALRRLDWLREAVRHVVIDDGWEDRVGHWEPNGKFPRGMAWLAERIREAGFLPGLWAAPFFAEAGSPVYDNRPQDFVQYEGGPYRPFALAGCGPPWGDRAYLDPTRPEVADFIYQQWRKFRCWGFRYFKTDFLANPFKLPRKVSDPGAPPDEPQPDLSGRLGFAHPELGIHRGHRRCMTALRAAIGEESFWLGCGSIWATGAGLMDASRVSADISVQWHDVVKCGRNAFLNQHAHGRIWLNDPDFLVVRGRDTASPELLRELELDDPSHSRSAIPDSLRLGEARVWASVILLSGGIVTLSDPIGGLNAEGLEILRTVISRLSGMPGRVLGWYGDLPAAVLQESGEGRLLGVFNWGDAPRAVEIPTLPKGTWKNLWSGECIEGVSALAERLVDPRSCLLLEMRAPGR